MNNTTLNTRFNPRRRAFAVAAVLFWALLGAVGVASAQDLQSELNSKEAQLGDAKNKAGVLSTDLKKVGDRINTLTGEVATLRNREAAVEQELAEKQAELDSGREHLEELRKKLDRSIKVLESRLIALYKSPDPDALAVILQADGFEGVIERSEYLSRIEEGDQDLVSRVDSLREDTVTLVESTRSARDVIASKERELERTRVQLEQQEAALEAAQGEKQAQLGQVTGSIKRLEGDISGLEDKIQAQLAAAAAAAAPSTASGPSSIPAGPIQGGSGSYIWPISGSVTSPFGQRWGRLHAGIDIGAAEGTPIRATAAGNIVLASPYGGYGNYTCIDHGGGLSSCYAHQSAFAITSGSVSQGEVIGYVGNTGASYGAHLHFEIRVNGTPVDPLGYL